MTQTQRAGSSAAGGNQLSFENGRLEVLDEAA
jgi:hypothetical protein